MIKTVSQETQQAPGNYSTHTPNGEQFPVLRPGQKLDMSSIRHPEENAFLAVIIVFNVLVFAALALIIIRVPGLIVSIVFYGLIILAVRKVSYVMLYWYIYGNSVLVGPHQYPDIYRAVQRACEFIDLKKVPRIFVLHGAGALELFLIKRFTNRGILIFTAEIIDTLLESGESRQLMMIIGRQLGHIKAGHYQGWFFKDIIGAFSLWFHRAWWRRCHFTADRVGFLVAGDLDISRRALLSITVGRTLSAMTSMDGIREQDSELHSHFFAWWRQLSSNYPYMIHRIIELESFREHVTERPIVPTAQLAVAALPPDVSIFQVNHIAHLYRLIEQHNRRLRDLELKAATFGMSCPSEVRLEIEDIKKEINRLREDINEKSGITRQNKENDTSSEPVMMALQVNAPSGDITLATTLCSRCGQSIRQTAHFCSACGARNVGSK